MNKETIEWLYFQHQSEALAGSAESKAAFSRCEAEFAKCKPNPTTSEQNDEFYAVAEYGAIERREGFIDGFRLAVKLMGEVYSAPGGNQE